MIIRICAIFFLFAFNVFASPVLKEASEAYDKGNFADAITIYEGYLQQLGDEKRAPYVVYNLANAYFRAGFLGKSIAAYLSARRDLPRNPEIKANLKYALSKTADKVEPHRHHVFLWLSSFSYHEMVWFSLLAACLGFSCLGFFYLMAIRKSLFSGALSIKILGFFSLLLAGGSMASLYGSNPVHERWTAVVAPKISVFSGPDERHNAVLFELHEGAPVMIHKKEASWFQIELSDGKKGWIKIDSVQLF